MLYKQGNQKIEVIVRRDTGSEASDAGTKGIPSNRGASAQTDKTDLGADIDSIKKSDAGVKQKALAKFVGAGIMQLAKQAAFRGFDYYISGIGMRTGDQALQAQINRKIEVVQDVINVGTSTLSGAIMGSSFGPIGTIFGAMAGTANSALNIGLRQAERERAYNYEVFKENNSIQYQKTRAALNMTNGRLR